MSTNEPDFIDGYKITKTPVLPEDEEHLDETFIIISKKEKKLKEALTKTEADYISTEINLGVCGSLIEFYKEEIKKEQDKNK